MNIICGCVQTDEIRFILYCSHYKIALKLCNYDVYKLVSYNAATFIILMAYHLSTVNILYTYGVIKLKHVAHQEWYFENIFKPLLESFI